MRSLPLIVASILLLGCSKGGDTEPSKEAKAESEKKAEPAADSGKKTGIDPAVLAAKIEPDACGMLSAATLQKLAGLSTAPTTEAGEADKPTRKRCLYRWTDDGGEHGIEVAWASSLQDQTDKIAKGTALARKDVAERRLQPAEVAGAVLATWGEHWLTVYANDRQVFWVITDKAGRSALEARTLATAIANEVVR